MGSCISKCRPKKSSHNTQEEEDEKQFNLVQDKLVIISQPPPKKQTPLKPINKISSPSPPASPSASTSSAASSLITRSSTTNTATSRSISSSSATSSKEYYRSPSFSNEFLWSYHKENPHIIRVNSNKENSIAAAAAAANSNATLVKPVDSTPKKRVRSSSPSSTTTLSRQKSFRRDYQNCRTSTRPSSSPSPGRRFVNGDLINLQKQDYSQRHSKRAVSSNSMSFSRRESISLRAPSPNNNINNNSSTRLIRPCLRNTSTSTREQYFNGNIHRIGSKIDEIAVAKAVIMADQHETDAVFMEDIDNPLISLDCFIFI